MFFFLYNGAKNGYKTGLCNTHFEGYIKCYEEDEDEDEGFIFVSGLLQHPSCYKNSQIENAMIKESLLGFFFKPLMHASF